MPERRRTFERQPPISKAEDQNLDRFGCTFRERSGVFYIDWRGKDVARAANAGIFASLVYVKTKVGPIILLACEISPVRPLPRYCYFPFDLRKQIHREYLSRFAETGEIRLRFLAKNETFDRTHRLTPYLRVRSSEMYTDALREWGTYQIGDEYDFDGALQLLEKHLRIPLFLERVLLEDTLSEMILKIKEAVQTVPNEKKEFATRVVHEAAEAFGQFYQANGEAFFKKLAGYRTGLACMIDLRRMFADNPAALIDFFTDGLAAIPSPTELERLSELVKVVASIPKLPFSKVPSSDTEVLTVPEIPAGLGALFQSMAASGITMDSLRKLGELVGLEIGGRSGRPVKDYSREYELKMAGSSWTEIARQALAEKPELQAEFGGRDYNTLDYADQQRLWNRIRQGVIGYAKRTGKPLPSDAEVSGPPAEHVQKTP
jgi:hypothetical protein